ncbi:DUF4199 domain-containing protein [Mucilaginibacter agri]|uniref:DUF4199 family protein n=1 Tax=Mucilaginibacter agri TaxID=2695265 RepID=A0A966DUT1_9SPHI|nr:DUF4199 domain-containing protein [Mucilaginibacter agri]NCD72100.1 DUF4199 family protein [Mucilaginibacter agri]
MKKNVFVFGVIAGLIVAAWIIVVVTYGHYNPDFQGSMWMGYASMLVAFSFVFVGIKNYRDKFNEGVISFGKAFKIGLYIVLIASTIYVLNWLIIYYCFIPDYMVKYTAHIMAQAQKDGLSSTEIAKQRVQMDDYIQMYKNPLMVIALTYLEILPVGLVVILIAALILKRKSQPQILASA